MAQEDGSLSLQGLDASMRQGLEDALFELNMSLANQAVAQGMPLMQYLHPDATHDGIRTLPRCPKRGGGAPGTVPHGAPRCYRCSKWLARRINRMYAAVPGSLWFDVGCDA